MLFVYTRAWPRTLTLWTSAGITTRTLASLPDACRSASSSSSSGTHGRRDLPHCTISMLLPHRCRCDTTTIAATTTITCIYLRRRREARWRTSSVWSDASLWATWVAPVAMNCRQKSRVYRNVRAALQPRELTHRGLPVITQWATV